MGVEEESANEAANTDKIPNYLSLIAGSTVGISSACDPSTCGVSYNSIANLLDAKGLSWKEYEESMPTSCDMSSSGNYVTKHNPFVFFTYVTKNAIYCDSHVVPLSPNLNEDLSANTLPAYSFITPNACNDGDKNCGEGTQHELNYTDKWLAGFLPTLINSPEFNSTVIFITFDQGCTGSGSVCSAGFGSGTYKVSGGQTYTAVIGPKSLVNDTSSINQKFSHYSTLATIEKIFALGNLNQNDTLAKNPANHLSV